MPRPRSFDEDQVMCAARDLFWKGGYAETSLDELADATGLGRGSLYGAFGDKHTLFLRTLDSYCGSVLDSWRNTLSGADALGCLRAHVRGFAAQVAADNARRGCMLAKSTAERGAVDADVVKEAQATFDAMHSILTRSIERAQAEGSIQRDADPAALGALLLALIRGIEALGRGGVDPHVVTLAAEQAVSLLPVVTPASN
jgi:AcrR family transcriptional regulator